MRILLCGLPFSPSHFRSFHADKVPTIPLFLSAGCHSKGEENQKRETFLQKGFLSPPPSPLLSPSQDFPMRASACSLMRERADRALFVTAKRLSAQIGNTGFRRRLGVAQGDCRKTGPPSNAFLSLLPVGLLFFHKTRPPRQILPLNRNSISAKVFGKGGMFLRK